MIDKFLGKSIEAVAKRLQVSECTIRRVVHENIQYKLYVMQKDQFISHVTRKNRSIRAKYLLKKLKHQEAEILWFFSYEKNFH